MSSRVSMHLRVGLPCEAVASFHVCPVLPFGAVVSPSVHSSDRDTRRCGHAVASYYGSFLRYRSTYARPAADARRDSLVNVRRAAAQGG
eukprot:3533727-Prymnesium_polylepis.1